MSLSAVSSGTIPPWKFENIAPQKRVDVLAIQSDDEVLYVVVVQGDSFHGHNPAYPLLALQTRKAPDCPIAQFRVISHWRYFSPGFRSRPARERLFWPPSVLTGISSSRAIAFTAMIRA
jgi:hypothetical protein